jgi:hypothetical protein
MGVVDLYGNALLLVSSAEGNSRTVAKHAN